MRVEIERVVYGGDGLGRAGDGRTVLVPFTLPGEWAELDQDKRLDRDRGAVAREGRSRGASILGGVVGASTSMRPMQLQISLKADILSETTGACGAPEPAEDRGSCVGAVGIPEQDSAAGGGWAGWV